MSVVLAVDVAVALVADGEQVLRHVERTPGRVAQMMRLGWWSMSAALTLARGSREHLVANLEEPWVPQILGVSPVWLIARTWW